MKLKGGSPAEKEQAAEQLGIIYSRSIEKKSKEKKDIDLQQSIVAALLDAFPNSKAGLASIGFLSVPRLVKEVQQSGPNAVDAIAILKRLFGRDDAVSRIERRPHFEVGRYLADGKSVIESPTGSWVASGC